MLLLIQTWQNNSERTINELERYGIFLKHMTMNQVLQMIRAHHDHRNKIESLLEALREQALTFQ